MSLSNWSKSSAFSSLVFIWANPTNSWISCNSFVVRVCKNNFVEFMWCVLSYPVRVKNSEVSASLSNSIFSNGSVRSLWFKLVNTLVDWFTVNNTFAYWSLSSSSSNSDSVNNVTLFSLVTELSGLVRSWGSIAFVNDW